MNGTLSVGVLPVGLAWAVRAALSAFALWAGLGSPSMSLLAALLPAQASTYKMLMPEHRLESFTLNPQGGQLSLTVRSLTTRYIVVQGKAYAPGIDFEASTPARSASLVAMVVVLGGLLLIRGRPVDVLWRAVLGLGLAGLLAIVTPATVLAGAQWGTAYTALEDLSRPALLVAASDFLVHGGGLALAAAAVWALRVDFLRNLTHVSH